VMGSRAVISWVAVVIHILSTGEKGLARMRIIQSFPLHVKENIRWWYIFSSVMIRNTSRRMSVAAGSIVCFFCGVYVYCSLPSNAGFECRGL
jgi:hypothetical protein